MRSALTIFRSLLMACLLTGTASTTSAQYIMVEVDSAMVFALCYEDMVDTGVTFICTGGEPVIIQICAGQLEACCDSLFIYDGVDTTAPLLYEGNSNGDVSNLFATSTGNSLTCRITSNDSINCWTAPYIPIVWSVGCGQGYPCTIGMQEPDQGSGLALFPVPAVDVLMVQQGSGRPAPRTYDVMDLRGSLVLAGRFTGAGTSYQMDVSALTPGSYVLRVHDEGRIDRARFQVTR